ncbi:etoposide-induced protein 2.4-domain-containing protein [Gilbertella persicaria]|uniref:etoposide-induced protein 2.4-domain-containing protein n=1 Tax=Gilbertella persicaria TaxID=101096 RepID=UPI002220B216|nr:etoposide-induced protein 2.4-domain-containing protein [Gilbertella persicaria]KAI8058681.1 etoposide-induced protein 2.4-domain-containing protein [Gilbertella persicaria]
MLTTFLLNGVLFLGGQVFLETFYSEARLLGCSYVSLLGVPTYFILLAVNGKFFGKVAEKSYQIQAQQTQQKAASTNVISSMASTVLTTLLYINCGVFASLLYKVPYVGILLSFLMNCMIFSYYCFEFQWVYKGWSIEKRLSFMESHWAFFLGFGFPATFITFFLSFLRSGAVFALIYPFFIIMAMIAAPKATTPYAQTMPSGIKARTEWVLPNKISFFYPVRKFNDAIITIVRLVGGVHADSIVSEKQNSSLKQE